MSNFTHISLPNPGVTTGILPDDLYTVLIEEITNIQSNFKDYEKWNYGLAGNIENQYALSKSLPYLEPFMSSMCKAYSKHWNFYQKQGKYEFEAGNLWVNFQKKNEFNPVHHHGGTFSFVCWLKIPYDIMGEMAAPHVKDSKNKAASTFQFLYPNILGNLSLETLYVDKSWEKRIILFPAHLSHCVYPFTTSDEYRISISGNLV